MVVRVLLGTWAALRAALIYGDAGRMMDQPLELWARRDAHLPTADSWPHRSGRLGAASVKRYGGEFPGRLPQRLGI